MTDSQTLNEISNHLKKLLNRSSIFTNTIIDSLREIDDVLNDASKRIQSIVDEIELKKRIVKNLNLTERELEILLERIDIIEKDKLQINNGPLGTFTEYIQKLETLQSIENYDWIREKYFQIYFLKYTALMRHGENILASEFTNVIKHYSSNELMKNFIEFVVNEIYGLYDKSETNQLCYKSTLFIPFETLNKLEQICCWFLKREQQYELYDDQNQHCDINQKLKFMDTRLEFIKLTLNQYFKLNTLAFKNEANKSLKSNINKLIIKATSQLDLANSAENSFLDQENDTKTAEYIDVFADNLDFSLKLLAHENVLVNAIYSKSPETCVDIISKLTILVLDKVQNEFENFFTDLCDFAKLKNNGDKVVLAIVRLLVKVHYLKEKTFCLRTEDLSSASKLLKFSIRLNELSSQVFENYLEIISKGYYNMFELPYDSGVHEYCLNVCKVWKVISQSESSLTDAIKNVCTNLEKKEEKKSDENNEDEIPIKYQRNRRKKEQKSSLSDEEDFDNVNKSYFTKYYLLVLKGLITFVSNESINYEVAKESNGKISQIFQKTSIVKFYKYTKNLKQAAFMINNISYLVDSLNELNIFEALVKADLSLNAWLCELYDSYVQKSCEIFDFLINKQSKLENSNEKSINFETTNDMSASTQSIKRTQKSLSKQNDNLLMFKEIVQILVKIHLKDERIKSILQQKIIDCAQIFKIESQEYGELHHLIKRFVFTEETTN